MRVVHGLEFLRVGKEGGGVSSCRPSPPTRAQGMERTYDSLVRAIKVGVRDEFLDGWEGRGGVSASASRVAVESGVPSRT